MVPEKIRVPGKIQMTNLGGAVILMALRFSLNEYGTA